MFALVRTLGAGSGDYIYRGNVSVLLTNYSLTFLRQLHRVTTGYGRNVSLLVRWLGQCFDLYYRVVCSSENRGFLDPSTIGCALGFSGAAPATGGAIFEAWMLFLLAIGILRLHARKSDVGKHNHIYGHDVDIVSAYIRTWPCFALRLYEGRQG